jgi:predicted  nucleic acid-binding Zn-ribbon protein
MPSAAQVLYRLQLLDSELAEHLSKLREMENQLGKNRELLAAKSARQQAEANLNTWRARLRELEMDLEVVNVRISGTEKRLYSGQVTNPKELASLQQDLQHSKRSRDEKEDQVLMAMERVDKGETELSGAVARLQATETAWSNEQDRLAQGIEREQAAIIDLRQAREELMAPLDAGHLTLYEELLRKKGGRAVSRLNETMCEGCHVTLPSSQAQQVRRAQELVTCPNCGRILASDV